MTWVAPITFVAGNALTAAQLNQNVRDNTGALNDRVQCVYKAADQTVNNSTTLVSDTHLKFTAVASQSYIFDMNLILVCTSATPDLALAFSFPTGTLAFSTVGLDTAATTATASARVPGTAGATSGTSPFAVATPSVTTGVLVRGTFKCTTGGTVNFQWAQSTATVVDTIIKQGSSLVAIRETT